MGVLFTPGRIIELDLCPDIEKVIQAEIVIGRRSICFIGIGVKAVIANDRLKGMAYEEIPCLCVPTVEERGIAKNPILSADPFSS